MRVLVDTSVLRRPHAGTARWVDGLVKALEVRDGLDVQAAAGPARIGNGFLFRPLNVARQRWWYESGMRREARRKSADVLLMPAGYACRSGSIPQVTTIHDVNFLTQPGTYEPLMARYLTWALGRAARESDALTTDSEFSRTEIARHLRISEEKLHVVYPGLEPPAAGTFASPLDRPYALFVGATEPHKNVGLLLDAWELLAPGLTLAIVGQPGRDHDRLQRRAGGSGGRVVLTGRVANDALEAWYRHASVFLFPSLTEGFGYPPLEAMARGVPVVAAGAGSLPEVLGEAALYHEPDDAAAVAGFVEDLQTDAALRSAQVRRGLAQAARYTWTAAAAQVESLLHRVVDDA